MQIQIFLIEIEHQRFIIQLIYRIDVVNEGLHNSRLPGNQTTAQLLQEDGQRFRGSEEQNSVDLRNIHAFVVNVHDEDESNLARNQLILGVLSLLIGGFSSQEHRRNPVLVKVPAHKFFMIHRYAEAQALHLVYFCHILEQRGHHMACTAICHGTTEV